MANAIRQLVAMRVAWKRLRSSPCQGGADGAEGDWGSKRLENTVRYSSLAPEQFEGCARKAAFIFAHQPTTARQLNEPNTRSFDQCGFNMIGKKTALNSSKVGPTLNVPLRVTGSISVITLV